MTSHYILQPFIWISIVWSLSSAFCGPIWLAKQPVVHDVMRHGFFAKALIQQRASLLKAVGSYPAVMIGGRVESQLMDQLSFSAKPMIDTLLINTVLCLDANVLVVCPFTYKASDQETTAFSLKQFALVFGKYSKCNRQTQIGGVTIPGKLYAAIGRFSSPALPMPSELFSAKTVMPLTNEIMRDYPIVLSSLLVGLQKDFGSNSLSVVLTDSNISKLLTAPQIVANVNYVMVSDHYRCQGGIGYDKALSYGTLYGSVLHTDYQVTLTVQKIVSKYSLGQNNRKKEMRDVPRSPGHVELNWDYKLPTINIPTTFAVGYGWLTKSLSRQTGAAHLFGGMKLKVTDYANLKLGIKLRHQDLAFKGFVAMLDVLF